MGYETYLVQMLQPLGVYDLSEGKINWAELAVYGTQMDLGADHLEDSGREMCLATAEGFGLERVEELIGEAGLKLEAVYDAFTLQPPKPESQRVYFVAREVRHRGKWYADQTEDEKEEETV